MPPPSARPGAAIAGRALNGIAIAFLALDAVGKIGAPAQMIAYSPPLGLPPKPGFYRLLGAILAACTLLYAMPRTAALGAVMLTGYLGGAVAAHLRVGSPLFTHTLFGVYLSVLVWAGLCLRDPRIGALLAGAREIPHDLSDRLRHPRHRRP